MTAAQTATCISTPIPCTPDDKKKMSSFGDDMETILSAYVRQEAILLTSSVIGQ